MMMMTVKKNGKMWKVPYFSYLFFSFEVCKSLCALMLKSVRFYHTLAKVCVNFVNTSGKLKVGQTELHRLLSCI